MPAVWYDRHGPPSVLRYGPPPLPEPGQVRVRLLASALAQLDAKLRAGLTAIADGSSDPARSF